MSLQVYQTTHNQLHCLPSSSCSLHLDELITGFYASCLCDRLADLDTAATAASSSSDRKSASSSVFKSLLYKAAGGGPPTSSNSTSTSFLHPELRPTSPFPAAAAMASSGPTPPPPSSLNISPATSPSGPSSTRMTRIDSAMLSSHPPQRRRREARSRSSASLPPTPVLETWEDESMRRRRRGKMTGMKSVLSIPSWWWKHQGKIEGGVREEEATTQNPRDLSPQAN